MKHLSFFLSLLILFTLFSSCSERQIEVSQDLPKEFEKTLDAHGNWEQWLDTEAFSYTLFHQTYLAQENHFYNRSPRMGLIDGPDYKIGFDGIQPWISPSRKAYRGPSLHFYLNLYAYFFSIPYSLVERGIQVEKGLNRTFSGKSYETFALSYATPEAHGPVTAYTLLIDPETKQLAWVLFKINLANEPEAPIQAMRYDEYRDANGLQFPRLLTGYLVKGDSVDRLISQVSFAEVILLEKPFDEDLFEMPKKGAVRAD